MSRVNTNEPAPADPDCSDDLVDKLPPGAQHDELRFVWLSGGVDFRPWRQARFYQ
jgi:hypothetical protein